jgi:hypothetical protein
MAPEPRLTVRRDWRWLYLIPCATFVAILIVGMALGPLLFMGRVPNFGSIGITKNPALTLPAAGLELAARQQMVTTTFLLLIATVLLVAFAFRTSRAVFSELCSNNAKTDAGRADYVLALVVIVVGMAGVGLMAALRSNYCGVPDSNHLYRCVGKGIVPDLIITYLKNMGVEVPNLKSLLDWSIDLTNIAVVAAGACLLFTLLLLPRGFDRVVKTGAARTPEKISTEELKRWLDNRNRTLNALSLLTALVFAAGIAQMFGWMNWPLSIMTKELLTGVHADMVDVLRESYQALVSSVLQFHAVWFGLLVAALIFPTNMVLFYKSRVLAREIIERSRAVLEANAPPAADDPNAAETEKVIEAAKAEIAAADEILERANAEATFKGYFDSYRGYLLALAPAIVQELLTLGS